MATIEDIRKDKEKAEARLDEAGKRLDEFMKEENVKIYEELWGMNELKKEKERLVKNEQDWKNQVINLQKKFAEFGKSEGNEQIA